MRPCSAAEAALLVAASPPLALPTPLLLQRAIVSDCSCCLQIRRYSGCCCSGCCWLKPCARHRAVGGAMGTMAAPAANRPQAAGALPANPALLKVLLAASPCCSSCAEGWAGMGGGGAALAAAHTAGHASPSRYRVLIPRLARRSDRVRWPQLWSFRLLWAC